MYGEGISKYGELLDLAVKMDVVRKSGAWFYYGEERLGQGRDNVKEYIKNNPEFCAEIEAKVREGINNLISARNPISRREQAVPVPVEPVSKETARAKIDIAVDDDE